MLRWARNHSRKDPAKLIDAIFTALDEQTVTVIGTDAVELVIPRVAAQIKELKEQRASAGHLAAYAGIAPVTRRSGTSIRGEFPARSGNKQLKKRALQIRLDRQLPHPESKDYYEKKRAQGKKHNAAVICLARRRCDVIFSMLKHGTLYEDKPA